MSRMQTARNDDITVCFRSQEWQQRAKCCVALELLLKVMLSAILVRDRGQTDRLHHETKYSNENLKFEKLKKEKKNNQPAP